MHADQVPAFLSAASLGSIPVPALWGIVFMHEEVAGLSKIIPPGLATNCTQNKPGSGSCRTIAASVVLIMLTCVRQLNSF